MDSMHRSITSACTTFASFAFRFFDMSWLLDIVKSVFSGCYRGMGADPRDEYVDIEWERHGEDI